MTFCLVSKTDLTKFFYKVTTYFLRGVLNLKIIILVIEKSENKIFFLSSAPPDVMKVHELDKMFKNL